MNPIVKIQIDVITNWNLPHAPCGACSLSQEDIKWLFACPLSEWESQQVPGQCLNFSANIC